jgi:acyl carrier protein
LDSLPLTANGKIDRAALPAPDRLASREATTEYAVPEDDLQRTIVTVFEELLGAAGVGVDDNFFDLGCNSLMMVQASVRLRAALGYSVSLVQLFQFPTVRSLASSLGTQTGPRANATIHEGQERAQARRTAMQRRFVNKRSEPA